MYELLYDLNLDSGGPVQHIPLFGWVLNNDH